MLLTYPSRPLTSVSQLRKQPTKDKEVIKIKYDYRSTDILNIKSCC